MLVIGCGMLDADCANPESRIEHLVALCVFVVQPAFFSASLRLRGETPFPTAGSGEPCLVLRVEQAFHVFQFVGAEFGGAVVNAESEPDALELWPSIDDEVFYHIQ